MEFRTLVQSSYPGLKGFAVLAFMGSSDQDLLGAGV